MKTAISIPDDTFDRATRRAIDQGWSRSEFFTRAARHYLAALDAESVSGQIDAAIEVIGEDGSAPDAVAVGQRLLADADNEW